MSIGDRFTDEADPYDPGAKDGKKIVGWVGIGGDEVKGQGEEEDAERLAKEKQEKHEIHFSFPDLTEFLVAGVFRRVVFRDATTEVIAESERPRQDEDACDGGLCAGGFSDDEKDGGQTDA